MAVSHKDYEEIKEKMGQRSAKEFVKASSSAKKKAITKKIKHTDPGPSPFGDKYHKFNPKSGYWEPTKEYLKDAYRK